eukprot:6052211-Amphidinium_carterae.3
MNFQYFKHLEQLPSSLFTPDVELLPVSLFVVCSTFKVAKGRQYHCPPHLTLPIVAGHQVGHPLHIKLAWSTKRCYSWTITRGPP